MRAGMCVYNCICISMYSTYIFYILATHNSIYSTYVLPTRCLSTYTTRLQVDRHYLCTTYILPCSTYVPLVWMHQLVYIPHTAYATPFPPQPTPTGG